MLTTCTQGRLNNISTDASILSAPAECGGYRGRRTSESITPLGIYSIIATMVGQSSQDWSKKKMAFEERQLNEIRDRVKVSEVVGSHFKLIKKGSEYVVDKNESFTVNDNKKFWCEFGSGGDGKPHDIFDFMQIYGGLTFVGAVEELSRRAGITLEQRPGRSTPAHNGVRHEAASDPRDNQGGDPGPSPHGENRSDSRVGEVARAKREVIHVWDYFDSENTLLYQTVRMQERLPDGSWRQTKDKKTWKTFLHRRPAGDGAWILGLDVVDRETDQPLDFIKTATGTAWLRATEERLSWKNITVRNFAELGNVEHWLYNANAVIDELAEPKDDQRTIFIPEGEAKVDVLAEWGLLAVTNSGGAKHFTTACAEFFRGARHVVLLQDNDRAGAERVAKIAPMLQAVGVELVQSLNFRDVWDKCPVKGDVKDWRDTGGGTKDQLLEHVDNLKPWVPEPYQSRFGAKTSADLGKAVSAYPWRIKGILPMNDNALLMGPSRSGKTFECLDMIMHIMRGMPFAGRKVIPGGYIYLTYEGATGFENRLRAYLKHHDLKIDDLHSFAWLTRPPNLFASEDNVVALATEIVEIAKLFRFPLAGIVVDTHNSATRGSSEIKSDDMNKIMSNYDIIKEKTGAPLIVIGHTNAEGRHRGNEQFFNNIETAVLIERVYTDVKKGIEKRDDNGRVIRRGKIMKQREGDDRLTWEFVLEPVKIGIDDDGDDITQMVSVEPASSVPADVESDGPKERQEGFFLRGNNVDVFRALLKALDMNGRPPPTALGLPASVATVINWAQLGMEYQKTDPREQDEDIGKYKNRIKARTRRFREDLLKYNVIGIAEMIDPNFTPEPGDTEKPRMIHFVWPTGRRVYGKGLQWPPIPKKKKEQSPLAAPGETNPLEGLF
jgi:hypothetical protein